jgi:hypothetical protein
VSSAVEGLGTKVERLQADVSGLAEKLSLSVSDLTSEVRGGNTRLLEATQQLGRVLDEALTQATGAAVDQGGAVQRLLEGQGAVLEALAVVKERSSGQRAAADLGALEQALREEFDKLRLEGQGQPEAILAALDRLSAQVALVEDRTSKTAERMSNLEGMSRAQVRARRPPCCGWLGSAAWTA